MNAEKVETEEPKAIKTLNTTQDGSLSLNTLSEQMLYAQRLMQEGTISSTFKSPQQVIIGIQYAKALKIDPRIALSLMYVINGKPCLYGEGPLSLCKRNGDVSKMEEYFVNDKYDRICVENKNLKDEVYAAVTRIWRKGDTLVQEDFFTVDDMARAGIDENKFGKKDTWKKYQRIMLRYRARTLALRSKFPDLIAGIPVSEYDYNFSPDTPEFKDVTPREDKTKMINEMFDKSTRSVAPLG